MKNPNIQLVYDKYPDNSVGNLSFDKDQAFIWSFAISKNKT